MFHSGVRRQARLQESGQTESGFRVVGGQQQGLSPRWRHGVARLAPGLIEFRPGLGGGIRLPRPGQQWLSIRVTHVNRAPERTVGLMESWSVSPVACILLVTTPTGMLEWAVSAPQRDWALTTVLSAGV